MYVRKCYNYILLYTCWVKYMYMCSKKTKQIQKNKNKKNTKK